VIDIVIVTPSRVPLRLWQKREPIEEGWGFPPPRPDVAFQQKTVKLIGMSRPLTINFDSVAWAEYDLKRKVELTVMNVRIRRRFKAIPFYVQRLFLADFERDVDIVLGEQVPAMLDPHVRGSLVGRVGTGMLQFLRLDDQGQLDVLFLGTSYASGLLTEIRWSNQSFKSIMLSDPYFAPALNETIRYGRRLI
jgi:hypothetical protein